MPEKRAAACHTLIDAMIAHPEMVAGPKRLDTDLMRAAVGKLAAKAGAEGYQSIALRPGALGNGSPALGIASDLFHRLRNQARDLSIDASLFS